MAHSTSSSPERNSPQEQTVFPASLGQLVVEKSLGFAIIVLDREGLIVSWNTGAERLFGYVKTEILGRYFGGLFRDVDQAAGMPQRELKVAEATGVASDDNWLVGKGGTAFWASGANTSLRDQKGELVGYSKVVRDASERKQLRAALNASEQKFRAAVAQLKDHAIFSTDAVGAITTWNDGCAHLFGYRELEALGTDAKTFLFREAGLAEEIQSSFRTAAEGGATSVDGFLTRKNGERFWATIITTVVRDQAKSFVGYTVVVRDLTERERADVAMRSSIERLQLLSDTARNLLVTDNPLNLLDRIFDRLVTSFDIDFYFHCAMAESDQMELRACRGITEESVAQFQSLNLSSALGAANGKSFEPCILENVQESTDASVSLIRETGVTAYACYPLVANLRLLGTLAFGTRRKPAFRSEQLDLFAAITHLFSEAITRNQVTAALTSREAQVTALLEGAPSGLLVLDGEGRVVMVNLQAEHLFGYPRADLVGKSIERLLPSRGASGSSVRFLQELLHPVEGSRNVHQRHEIIARCKDGTELPLEVWFSAPHNPKAGFIIAAFIDITERRRAEKTLRENERKLRFLNELEESTRALRDPVQIMALITRQVGEHLGVSRCAYADVETDGEHFSIPQDYSNGVASSAGHYLLSLFGHRVEQDMHGGRTLILRDVANELPAEEGRGFAAISIEAIICCPLLKEGRLNAMMAVHQNRPRNWTDEEIDLLKVVVERCWSTIERAKVEQALRQKEERLKLAMDAGRLGMWHLDTVSRQAVVDGRIREFYGLPSDAQAIDLENLLERIHPADRAHVSSALDQAARGGAHFDAEFRIIRPDGTLRWLAAKGDLVQDQSGTPPMIIGVNYDLTARKKAEDELHAAQSALQRHAKDLESVVAERTVELRETVAELERFSYSLSHDMRAPLRAMQGFSQIVEEEYGSQLDDTGRDYLKRIGAAAGRLDQLIRDVLSYTQVVREDVRLQPMHVAPLLRQLIAENPALQPPLADVVVETPLLPVMGHEAYLTQCLSNLVTNAVKFIEPGRKPLVRIWTESIDQSVRVFVQDNGIGVPKEWQARIFGMFERMHPASHYEGTGIGLTIVRKAAERMGGFAGVDSEPGQGSTFWIQLNSPPLGSLPY